MTAQTRTYDRRRTMQSIHCACRDLGFDTEMRHAMQLNVTGKASMTDMSDVELQNLRSHIRDLGWTPNFRREGYRETSKKAHVRKVYALWGDLKRSGIWREAGHDSLDRFVARLTGISSTEWLTPAAATKVIEALKDMKARGHD